MINSISPINFKSNIKLITPDEFKEKIASFPNDVHEIAYPWTPDDIKFGDNIFTIEILDCVAGGIVDGDKVKAFHQADWKVKSAEKYSQKVFDIDEFETELMKDINLKNKDLHGLLLGGLAFRHMEKDSFLNKIKSVFEKYNIPYSAILNRKDVHHYGTYSLFYENKTDTWYVSYSLIGKKDLRGKGKAVELDESTVNYTLYGTPQEHYEMSKKKGTVKNFFESQFEEVALSKFDRFV